MLAVASIPPLARVADPLTVAQLDAHPEAARLWATIERVREEMREEMEDLRKKMRGLQGRVEDVAMDLADMHAVLSGEDEWDERSEEERVANVQRKLLAAKQTLYEIAEEEL